MDLMINALSISTTSGLTASTLGLGSGVIKVGMITGFTELIKAITPPKSTEPGITAWRYKMVGLSAITALALTLHMTGWLPGHTGYASADQFNELLIESLEDKILDNFRRQCRAIETNDDDSKIYYQKQLNNKQRKYAKVAGGSLDLPSCKAV